MNRRYPVLCDGVSMGFRTITFVAREPVLRIGLVKFDHAVVAVDFR